MLRAPREMNKDEDGGTCTLREGAYITSVWRVVHNHHVRELRGDEHGCLHIYSIEDATRIHAEHAIKKYASNYLVYLRRYLRLR